VPRRRYRELVVAIVPSYLKKLTKASEDLTALEAEIERYVMRDPYRVVESAEGRRQSKVRRLEITADPANTEIPTIAAGIIYNLRSGLDHFFSALVPKKQRGSVQFPIYFAGVWEDGATQENAQRAKERGRWRSNTKELAEPVLDILKGLQPADGAEAPADETHVLQTINQLANTDDHTRAPVAALGLSDCMVKWTLPDGTVQYGTGHAQRDGRGRLDAFIQDGSKLKNIPFNATSVEVAGVPVVALHIASQGRHAPIPHLLTHAAGLIEKRVITPLIPFVRSDAE
jgi:hypothetical protein